VGTTNWTYALPTPLEGTYTISSHAIDGAGNEESTYTITIVYDKTIPEVSLAIDPANPDGDNGWYDSNPEIALSASDNMELEKIEYQIDSQATGGWEVYSSAVEISDGEKVFYYRSLDKVGNYSDVGSKSVKVDTEDPEDPNGFDAEYRAGSQTVRLSWDADGDVDKFYLYRGGSRDFDLNTSTRIAKQDGNDDAYNDDVSLGKKYYYKIVARDEAGNSSDAEVLSIDIPGDEGGEAVVVYEGVQPLEGDVTEEGDVVIEGEATEEGETIEEGENPLGDTEGASDEGDSSIVKGDQDENSDQEDEGLVAFLKKYMVAIIVILGGGFWFVRRRMQG
jgi:hypothetical protein